MSRERQVRGSRVLRGATMLLLLIGVAFAFPNTDDPAFGGGSDPDFVPTIAAEMYQVNYDDPNVVDGVLQDDGYMQEPPDNDPALVTSDRQHLNEFQDYAHLYEVIDN